MWIMMTSLLTIISCGKIGQTILYLDYFISASLDNISLVFILLTLISFFFIIFLQYSIVHSHLEIFSILLIVLFIFLGFSFLVCNLFIYFLCYEFVIFGTLLLVLVLGFSIYSISAGFFLFLFTCLGTITFFFALLITTMSININNSTLGIGILLFLTFSIKIPCWPFHYWLLLVHSESSTSLSLFLAALLLKFGLYGFLLYCFIYSLSLLCSIIISNSIFSVVIVVSYFLSINDFKLFIALNSVAHMNFSINSLFAFNFNGFLSLFIISVAHGFSSIGLFLFAGYLINLFLCRTFHSFWFFDFSARMFLLFLLLANISFPGSINFIGEFLSLIAITTLDWLITCFYFIAFLFLSAFIFLLYNFKLTYYSFFSYITFSTSLILFAILQLIYIPGFLLLMLHNPILIN